MFRPLSKVLVPRNLGVIISLVAMGIILGFGFVPKAIVQLRALKEFKVVASELQKAVGDNERLKLEYERLQTFLGRHPVLEYPGVNIDEGKISVELRGDDPVLMNVISDMVTSRRYKLDKLELVNLLPTPFSFGDMDVKVRLQLNYSELELP
ncbi:MAG: hypothetical protein PWP37_217 [Thermotogota bacterium]|nr:hypothetical protein [Thermotogota bacterium]MDK2864025.1 hypothetical protein [Thermotogota bacterium]HCZ06233.1 hypothetical protein [Thermotogota bacterium]